MTAREIAKLKVAERLIEGKITIKSAVKVLRISTRQVKRIKKKVRLNGPKAIIHGNRSRKPINAAENKVKDLVEELKTKKYGGTNFSHFTELLEGREDIMLNCSTVKKELI